MKLNSASVKIIHDSRGQETLLANLGSLNYSATASAPAGKSRGVNEAFVLEPHLALLKFTSEIKDKILNRNFNEQAEFDNWLINLDGTTNKKHLGGNLLLSLSLAFARLKAQSEHLELFQYINLLYRGSLHHLPPTTLPLPILNLINGGRHANNNLDFQEFQIIPRSENFSAGLAAATGFYHLLGRRLKDRFGSFTLGDEAGYSADFGGNEQALKTLKEIALELAFQHKLAFDLSIDVAASSFYDFDSNLYLINQESSTSNQLTDYYEHLIHKYGLIALEDPYHENAFADFSALNKRKGLYIVADDLTVTNPDRVKMAIDDNSADAIIIKPNQIGTLTETITAAKLAHDSGWQLIASHRSGETEDDWLADLAVGLSCWGIKAGAPATSYRLNKYHRLLAIAKIINN